MKLTVPEEQNNKKIEQFLHSFSPTFLSTAKREETGCFGPFRKRRVFVSVGVRATAPFGVCAAGK